jgi:hypothetical protein
MSDWFGWLGSDVVAALSNRTGASGGAGAARVSGLDTQHDASRTSALACRSGGDDNRFLGAPQPLDLLIKLSDARSRSGSQ